MSKKKQQPSRLDSLFKDVEVIAPELPKQEPGLSGWYWECSLDGQYLLVSPEVQDCLGVPADEFNGRSIFDFHIQPDSAAALRIAFQQESQPREVEVCFITASRDLVSCRMNILSQTGKNGHEPRWQGFAQVLAVRQQPTLPVPRPEPAAPVKTAPQKPATGTLKLNGLALESGEIHPTSTVWTRAAVESLAANQPVAQHAAEDAPPVLAVPIQLRDKGTGIVEIVDDNGKRKWTEDEQQLVMEIANQLALALENAELYQTAQQELSERARAEEEIRSRNQDLAILNQAGQQMSRLTQAADIYELLTSIVQRLLGSKNLSIAQFDANQRTVKFPVLLVDGVQQESQETPVGNDIAGYIFWTKSPLLITHNVEAELVDKGINLPDRAPKSILALPMLAGERPTGAFILQDFEQENAYTSIHVELLSTLASQASTALENANLFQEIRSALAAIENRERYQANVALVAATLSKYGSKSLPEVLASLGEAARNSRVYFAQIQQDEQGSFWQSATEWVAPDCPVKFDRSHVANIPTTKLPYILSQLRETGYISCPVSELPSPDREFFRAQRVTSILVLSVPGKTVIPSFVTFEQTGDQERTWQLEEIRLLQVATDALSNTILRENLLKQVQVSLRETETLYNLSHNLALANDAQEMLATIASGLQAPDINRLVLVSFDYNTQGNLTRMTVTANWHSGGGTPPPAIGSIYSTAVYSSIFFRSSPVFFNDTVEDSVDPQIRTAWNRENIHSLAVLPLWIGKTQIGVLLVMAETVHAFNEQLQRSIPPLADQLATSVENTNLFNETQNALAETELLYRVSQALSQATDVQDLVMVIAKNLMPARADRVAIGLTQFNAEGEMSEVEIIASYDVGEEAKTVGARYPATALRQFFSAIAREPVMFPDISTSDMDGVTREIFRQLGIRSVCGVPLWSSGHMVGVILISSKKDRAEFSNEEMHNLQVAANNIAVALERQRLLGEAQRRALELQTAAEIARDTTSTLALDQLLGSIVNLLCERFNFYHASIFLLDNKREYAVIRESTGEAGEDMKNRSHKLLVGSKSIIGTVTASGEPMIINDTENDPIHHKNPLLPETRSEMAIPLKLGEQVMGALDLQSRRLNAFSKDDLSVLQILADQIAIAIENARAYEISQKAVEEMREVDRVKSQFLANMSHELRTPLNSIIGFSRVILKGIDGPVNETQSQDLNAIYNSGQHLLRLINDILDLSKIEAGKMELSFAEVNLTEMVNSVMSTATGLVKGKPVKLTQIIPTDIPVVRADNTRVRQVLLNFLSNAAKFTDEGSITVEAQIVRSPKNKPEVMISVTDTGPGIAAADTHKLFQPFSQVDDSPTRKTGGTGLGLSICRSLIEMHGGRIGLLRSEVGVGSTFFFTLPLPVEVPEPDPAELPAEARTILAIDDDLQVISLYERYLKPHGYRVVPLTNPKQAVERAKELKPSAITLDIMMPERDGWQVMRDLRANPDTKDIPVIVCSILEETEKGFNLGAADYLVKPFAQDDLIRTIQRLNSDGQIREVLVIDDSPTDLRLVQKMIEDSGVFQVATAEGGQAGWDIIQSKRPDAVILDLFMPGMNGFELLGRLRAEPELAAIPVIVLTGADLTPEQQQQLAEFGQGLLAKSHLNEKELISSLEQSLLQYHLIEDKTK